MGAALRAPFWRSMKGTMDTCTSSNGLGIAVTKGIDLVDGGKPAHEGMELRFSSLLSTPNIATFFGSAHIQAPVVVKRDESFYSYHDTMHVDVSRPPSASSPHS